VGPQGAHARLQQGPPHWGSPLSMYIAPAPPQSSPSTLPQLAAPAGGLAAHTPSVCPLATLHTPVQQSPFAAHASPGCAQNDEGWQAPAEHSPEQQLEPLEQGLPSVEHEVFKGVHFPPLQVWLQHWPSETQAALSA
jgi:hypothetical protein